MRTEKKSEFFYKGGIISFVEYINRNKGVLHKKPIYVDGEREDCSVEVALQYNDTYGENIFSFANSINTTEGGTHMSGFKSALTRVINNYALNNKMIKDVKESLKGEDVREGLSCVISVRLRDPQFEGQTKTKLGNSEVKGLVEQIIYDKMGSYFEEKPVCCKIAPGQIPGCGAGKRCCKARKELTRRKIAQRSWSPAGEARRLPGSRRGAQRILLCRGRHRWRSAKQGGTGGFRQSCAQGQKCSCGKSALRQMLQNEEIKVIVTALGAA